MNVLLTGAFGNVGTSTLDQGLAQGKHEFRCFDVATPVNQKVARKYAGKVETLWGDIRNEEDCKKAVAGVDVILHVAALIPPASEKNPELSKAVNLDGTVNLIKAAEAQDKKPKFVFTSSCSVYGRTPPKVPVPWDAPLDPIDNYATQKVEAEKVLMASGLDWSIQRCGAIMPLKLGQMDPLMFEIKLESHIHYVHTLDVGLALLNSVDSTTIWGKILHLGGGKESCLDYREFYQRILHAVGVSMPPEEAFGPDLFYTEWMDTTESQALLNFQQHTFEDYLATMRKMIGWQRPFAVLFSPFIKMWMLSLSPYYKENMKKKKQG